MENAKLKETHRLIGHSDKVFGLAWNPSSSSSSSSSSGHHHPLCMASVAADNTIRLWQLFMSPTSPSSTLNNYRCKALLEGRTHDKMARSCSWSPCGTLLAAARIDRSTSIYKNQEGQHVPLLCFSLAHKEDKNEVNSVCWSASGSMLAMCGGANNCISIWKINPQNIASAPWLGDVADDEDESSSYRISHRQRDQHQLMFPDAGNEDVLYSEAMKVDCGEDELYPLCKWRVKKEKDFTVVACLRGHAGDVNKVHWHPTVDIILFSCSSDHTVKVWAPQDGHSNWQCVQTLDEANDGHTSVVWDLSFNASGDKMVTCSADGTLKVWKLENTGLQSGERFMHWEHLSTLAGYHDGIIFSVNWSREGIIASGGADGIGLFVVENNESEDDGLYKLLLKEEAPEANVNSVQWGFGEDRLLASASDDGLIKVWKLEHENEEPVKISDPIQEANDDDKTSNPEANAKYDSRPKRPKTRPKSWDDYVQWKNLA